MKLQNLFPLALVALAGLTLGSGCPTIPKVEDRIVEMALGASTTLEFQAEGILNTYDDVGIEDLAVDFDLNKALDDAGIDVSDLKDIKLAGVSYRVTVPDPNAGRAISNATVTARRGAGVETALVTNFNQNVDAVTGWTTAPLDPAGVTLINGLLTDMVTAAKNHTAVPNSAISYHVHGTSTPTDVTTTFTWQLRVDLTIIGTIKVKVLD